MPLSYVHRLQLYLRRRGRLLRGDARHLEEPALERVFEVGEKQVARLAREIEAVTGCGLDSRRALDFGCGRGRLAIPLATRCEHVYGLDIRPPVLREAARNAKRFGVDNVEWLESGRLAELSGSYDLVLSVDVFPHIPSREGERIIGKLLDGMRPGGIGAIHVALRPGRPVAALLRRTKRARANPASAVRDLAWLYPYLLMNSYSLDRLGRLFAAGGVTEWHTKWHPRSAPLEAVTIVFQKGANWPKSPASAATAASGRPRVQSGSSSASGG
jgi:2-polyprenyl-3-methyl-5-hydroxy-6-metoxy-1,4-benzoquinol methylase